MRELPPAQRSLLPGGQNIFPAVFKAAPKLLFGGIAIGAVGVISFNKCLAFMKMRKHKIEKEPELRKEFVKETSKEVENEKLVGEIK